MCFLTAVKCGRSLQKLRACLRKACRRLVERRRVRFDHRKASSRLADICRVRFVNREACSGGAEL